MSQPDGRRQEKRGADRGSDFNQIDLPPNLRKDNFRPSEKWLPKALPIIIPPSEEKLLWLRLSSFKTLSPFKKINQDIVISYTHICLHYNTTIKLNVAKWEKDISTHIYVISKNVDWFNCRLQLHESKGLSFERVGISI